MTDDIVNAISVVEAVDGTLKDAISNDTTSVSETPMTRSKRLLITLRVTLSPF